MSISPEANAVKRVLPVVGTNSIASESLRTAAATARHTATSKPCHTPFASGSAKPGTPVETGSEAVTNYLAGACDVFTTDRSALAARRANFEVPTDHVVLPEIVSKEPLGPLVRHGDNNWGDVVRWTLNALITAEELGVTSANLEEMSKGTNNPEMNRLLGSEGNLGEMLGLDAEWAKRAIAVSGNYGEIFENNIGAATIIGLARGVNAKWTDGGLIYSPPFR